MRRNLDPGNLPGALRVAVKEALDSGWTAKKGGSGGWKLRSPGGTEWMHVSPGTNIPDNEAVKLRTKVKRASMNEAPPDLVEAAKDPKQYQVTTHCSVCNTEFLAWDGFVAHQDDCHKAAAAALAAEEEASKAITPPVQDEPSEGPVLEVPELPTFDIDRPIPGYTNSAQTPPKPHRPDLPKESDSGKMGSKEEVAVNGGNKRGSYRKRQFVQEGMARALYKAMLQRRQYKDEALSKYANALAKIIDESGFEYAVLDEAESKLAQIFEVLDIDPAVADKVDELSAENKKLHENLDALRELINGIGGGK